MMRLPLFIFGGFIAVFALLFFFFVLPENRETNRIRTEQRAWCTDHGFATLSVTEKHGSGKNEYILQQVLCMDKDRRLIFPE